MSDFGRGYRKGFYTAILLIAGITFLWWVISVQIERRAYILELEEKIKGSTDH